MNKDWLDKELEFIHFLYKYKSFLGKLKRKDFKEYPKKNSRKLMKKEFEYYVFKFICLLLVWFFILLMYISLIGG